jgi:DNA-binding NtrC family response regulator
MAYRFPPIALQVAFQLKENPLEARARNYRSAPALSPNEWSQPMDNELTILIVSCRPENRKMLLRVFDGLPIDSYSASTLQQAKEALRLRSFSVVFCEERLADGTYGDLLRDVQSLSEDVRFVVMLCTGEWDEYLEALRLGAEEVLRCPLQPTDIDLALIHAMRGAAQKKEVAVHA